MKTILFVCTGNTCRSSMAEALLKDLLEKYGLENVRVLSAGTAAVKGDRASRASVEIMRERDLCLQEHRARPLTKALIEEADLILTMTANHKKTVLDMLPEAREKVYTLKEYVNGGEKMEDVLDAINRVYQKIEEKKQRFLMENHKKLKVLKEKREELLRELKTVEQQVIKIEGEFQETIAEEEDRLIQLKGQVPDLDIVDPFGQPMEVYRSSAQEIEEHLKKLLKKISNK
ncbi:protein-tyrosine-phosphatase YwlE [Clostridium aceticum]|uniref:Protein-tyrosine-phosphatase YwlE n=1 Tax=Clostridium aceticum TaxID=84022 RepID=A0A0D8I699_9CLOT|nr:low molecular weight protein arginine phosphatase [Clostridium aceticum]AKL93722.1 protein-tyrosine-phosphatase YwlE [Clostridium aceticum]KJF25768.1 hypothetical protein TZ02_16300 [Clostridium aceticum]